VITAPGNERPGRFVLWAFRLPQLIYRLGLGGAEQWLGLDWIEVTTTGRKSGRRRTVLLDLIGEDPAAGRFFAQSAYGSRSDWVKNLERDPRCEVRVGRRRHRARAAPVPEDEARRVLLAYVRAHRFYSPLIARVMGYRGESQAESLAPWLLERFGMVAFEIGES
jgi:deazaflavin-dependent oxidoreductase (nitroreductase family)